MELLFDPAAWASLITLTALEVVLGVDNIVVLSILTHALPQKEAQRARALGLGLALALRLALLSAISWITHLTYPVFSAGGQDFSWRDLILIGGGLFLMVKAIQEIHAEIEGGEDPSGVAGKKASFGAVISQIAIMDLVFSLDSIITAVGLARHIEVMVAAICISIGIMYAAAEPVGGFIKRHPTTKMLGLCFLILIGVALVADGFQIHIPRGSIYFAMAFAGVVETINIWAKGSLSRISQMSSPKEETFESETQQRSPPDIRTPLTKGGPVPHPTRKLKAHRRRSRKK
jgi:predicted tellurium resistance membrane protein TerC